MPEDMDVAGSGCDIWNCWAHYGIVGIIILKQTKKPPNIVKSAEEKRENIWIHNDSAKYLVKHISKCPCHKWSIVVCE
jgi:hypothetical protein